MGKTVGLRVGFGVGWRVGAGVAAHDELFNGIATKPSKHLQLKWLFAVTCWSHSRQLPHFLVHQPSESTAVAHQRLSWFAAVHRS